MIYPSVIAKNQTQLNALLKHLKGASSTLHLDVLDGKFAPNKSLDFSFRLSHAFKYNAHLMIKNPFEWAKQNYKRFTVCIPQFEEIKDVDGYISWMKQKRQKVAFALSPKTKVSEVVAYLDDVEIILILTVHPGFYGGKYRKGELRKIAQIRKINPKIRFIVDGHMNPQTVRDAVQAGADHIVSGSFVSLSKSPKKAVRELQKAMK